MLAVTKLSIISTACLVPFFSSKGPAYQADLSRTVTNGRISLCHHHSWLVEVEVIRCSNVFRRNWIESFSSEEAGYLYEFRFRELGEMVQRVTRKPWHSNLNLVGLQRAESTKIKSTAPVKSRPAAAKTMGFPRLLQVSAALKGSQGPLEFRKRLRLRQTLRLQRRHLWISRRIFWPSHL